ncbi:hypothetical protein [Nocardia sp. CA-119907]|uniref:hypothetical protein n=1 Tax=Nocardia sp. CA-119907 TaxID=3239973 RepID=UPI003D97FB42
MLRVCGTSPGYVVGTLEMFGATLGETTHVIADAAELAELPADSSLAEDTMPGLTDGWACSVSSRSEIRRITPSR